MFTYIEKFSIYNDEEWAEIEKKSKSNPNKRGDSKIKPDFLLIEKTQDLSFALWANVVGKQIIKKINFGFYQSHLPHNLKSQVLIMRNNWASFDYVSGRENSQKFDDLCIGGVVNNRTYHPPEFPRGMLKWQMRRIKSLEETLEEWPYPDPNQSQIEPIQVVYQLPPYVYIHETDEPRMAVWDDTQQCWSSDFIEDLEFNRKEKEITYSTRKFAPMAYMQAKCTDYPYDSWYIRCVGEQLALLSIVTKRKIKINIEIYPLYVKLVDMEEEELSHIVNKELHPGVLLMQLSKCGIHLMPEDDDAARGGIHLKDKATEERAILDISQTIKVFAF
jgi:cancer susceptibility candidate protein 1